MQKNFDDMMCKVILLAFLFEVWSKSVDILHSGFLCVVIGVCVINVLLQTK